MKRILSNWHDPHMQNVQYFIKSNSVQSVVLNFTAVKHSFVQVQWNYTTL